MLTFPKPLTWLLLATLPCLSLRCVCDGCHDPCPGQYIGGLGLRPGSAQWLPAPMPDSLHFINSNGYRAVFDLLPPLKPDSVALPAYYSSPVGYSDAELSRSALECTQFFRAGRVSVQYRGRNLNVSFGYNLLKDLGAGTAPVPTTSLTRAVADTLPDIVTLSFNQQFHAGFPVVSRPFRQPRFLGPGEVVYLDSVRLAGHTFVGVYQYSLATASPTSLQPQRFFFRPGQGLVGFTYTNNEQWARL